MRQKQKRLLLAQKGQVFFQRKGSNLDILLIEHRRPKLTLRGKGVMYFT